MSIDLEKLYDPAVNNIHSFIDLLNDDLWNNADYTRELGSLTDLPNEL